MDKPRSLGKLCGRCSQVYLKHIICLHGQASWQVLLNLFCKLSGIHGGLGEPIIFEGQVVKRVFSPFCIGTKNNLLNRQTLITANCLMLRVSSWDLGDLPSNQTQAKSDSGMLTLLSDGWAGDYSGVEDWPLHGWGWSAVYNLLNTHQAKKKDSLSLSG